MSDKVEKPSLITIIWIHLGFYILLFTSALSYIIRPKLQREKNRRSYKPLFSQLNFFSRSDINGRARDIFGYPISSAPGVKVTVKQRKFDNDVQGTTNFRYTGEEKQCLNLGSYDYLGFSENTGSRIECVIDTLYKHGLSTGASSLYYGSCDVHRELDLLTAEFLGVEDSVNFGMGFATNSVNLSVLVSPGCLVLSDEKNHSSIIFGLKTSKATVKVFRHNDVNHLEELLKHHIYHGQPQNSAYTPWKKILIIVEGVYCMEGTIARLPKIIALKKKYKAYLYMDEAHSIGAIGKTGRGVMEYFQCNPEDVDVLMGTYTKTFASAGGFLAGKKELISYLRNHSFASKYGRAMSPPVAAQAVGVLKILMGKDGTNLGKNRVQSITRNAQYFRRKINQMGFITYGDSDSPVVPILTQFCSKTACTARMLMDQYDIAAVGVGYPATPILERRMRICLSAGHTKEQLDYVLEAFSKVGDQLGLKNSRLPRRNEPIDYD